LFGQADLFVLGQACEAVGDGPGRAAVETLSDGGRGQRAVLVLAEIGEDETVKL
jgi:hypothetical protein